MRKLLFLAVLFIGSAQAAPVTWYLDSVFLDNGASVTGSFVYDPDIYRITSVQVTVTNRPLGVAQGFVGPVLSADPYLYDHVGISGDSFGFTVTDIWIDPDPYGSEYLCNGISDCGRRLTLEFESSLASGLNTIPIRTAFPSREELGNIAMLLVDTSDVISGSVTTVPIPAAAWLFGSALIGLGWMRREQAA